MDKIYLYIWRKNFTRYKEKMLPLSKLVRKALYSWYKYPVNRKVFKGNSLRVVYLDSPISAKFWKNVFLKPNKTVFSCSPKVGCAHWVIFDKPWSTPIQSHWVSGLYLITKQADKIVGNTLQVYLFPKLLLSVINKISSLRRVEN